jgi:hypothetical protein
MNFVLLGMLVGSQGDTMKTIVEWNVAPLCWDTFLERCPEATFFHTSGWYQAMGVLGYRPATVYFRFEDAKEALLPLATRRVYRCLVQEAHAGVEGGYGGLLAPEALSEEQAVEAFGLVRKRFPNLRSTSNPHGVGGREESLAGQAGQDVTQVMPILAPDAQAQAMSRRRLKQRNVACEAGVTLEILQHLKEEDVGRFYPLYAAHAASWQIAKLVRDEAYFRSLLRHAGDNLVLFLALYQGEAIGFRLVGIHGPVVMDLHLITNKNHDKLNTGAFLWIEPLAWYHARGFTAADVLSSGPLEGVRAYKASFGASPLGFAATEWNDFLGRSLRQVHRLMRSPMSHTLAPG